MHTSRMCMHAHCPSFGSKSECETAPTRPNGPEPLFEELAPSRYALFYLAAPRAGAAKSSCTLVQPPSIKIFGERPARPKERFRWPHSDRAWDRKRRCRPNRLPVEEAVVPLEQNGRDQVAVRVGTREFVMEPSCSNESPSDSQSGARRWSLLVCTSPADRPR